MSKYKKKLIDNSYINENTGCWIWTKRINPDGYGEMRYNGRKERAHRVSAIEFLEGRINGKVVMHSCDTPSCVNPNHLSIGTQSQNIADRNSKGRTARAEAKWGIYTWEQVNEARKLAEEEGMNRKDIARKLGFRKTALQAILTYKSWIPDRRVVT